MGRKAEFSEKPRKGPGRKARKQKPPTFPKKSLAPLDNSDDKKLSHRQKQRLIKRDQKKKIQNAKDKKFKLFPDENKEAERNLQNHTLLKNSEKRKSIGFSDENKQWLKPKSTKNKTQGKKDDLELEVESNEEGSDSDDQDQESETDEQESGELSNGNEILKVGSLADISDDENEDANSNDDFDVSDEESDDTASNNDVDEDDDVDSDSLLPIERENKN
ncbi:unnamed protein product [Ceratitis capitata]|uniref:(Mediterranean fruit fly) hypothetical protein n=1 Tax=Ceratitis capitata TaxID=7213 RepID=A0A811VKJ8_CERCA|nr:unnamed protein product [Ceratitis capitata]